MNCLASRFSVYRAPRASALCPTPEHPDFLEEMWFYEAITETYIPLLDMFEDLAKNQVDFRITMSLTPPLVSMFSDPLLQNRYVRHLEKLIELAGKRLSGPETSPSFTVWPGCITTSSKDRITFLPGSIIGT